MRRTLHKIQCQNFEHGKVIITGKRNAKSGLWNIPLAPKDNSSPTIQPQPTNRPRHQANGAIQNLQTKQDLAGYLHGCNLSTLPSAFLRAVQRGHYKSWPGLTPSLISKHLPKALATSKGHLRMQQKKSVPPNSMPTSCPSMSR
jgi:hypothetical protein